MSSISGPNGVQKASSSTATHLTIPLGLSPHTSLQACIEPLAHVCMIFLTTTTPASSSPAALGSFVYAIPNRLKPAEPLCTALYAQPSTVDFATRVAKVVARKLKKPIYVGWSGELGAVGAQVEEEMEGLRKAIETILGVLQEQGVGAT